MGAFGRGRRPAASGPGLDRAVQLQREQAIRQLRVACMDGQLSVDELIRRTESAQEAATLDDIRNATADIARPGDGSVSSRGRARRAVIDILSYGATCFVEAIRSRVLMVAAVGEMTIDFRRVAVTSRTTVITAVAFFGEMRIIIPATMRYNHDWTVAFLGRACTDGQNPPGSTGPLIPIIRLRSIGVFGNVLVQRVPGRNEGPAADAEQEIVPAAAGTSRDRGCHPHDQRSRA
jgi:DUF1707 SHOCT-like domain